MDLFQYALKRIGHADFLNFLLPESFPFKCFIFWGGFMSLLKWPTCAMVRVTRKKKVSFHTPLQFFVFLNENKRGSKKKSEADCTQEVTRTLHALVTCSPFAVSPRRFCEDAKRKRKKRGRN